MMLFLVNFTRFSDFAAINKKAWVNLLYSLSNLPLFLSLIIYAAVKLTISQSINQSISQSVSQSVSQSISLFAIE